MKRRKRKSRSLSLIVARRRNWAKMRIAGMYATARQLSKDEMALSATEMKKIGDVAEMIGEVLDEWG